MAVTSCRWLRIGDVHDVRCLESSPPVANATSSSQVTQALRRKIPTTHFQCLISSARLFFFSPLDFSSLRPSRETSNLGNFRFFFPTKQLEWLLVRLFSLHTTMTQLDNRKQKMVTFSASQTFFLCFLPPLLLFSLCAGRKECDRVRSSVLFLFQHLLPSSRLSSWVANDKCWGWERSMQRVITREW